jgi:hypothetical protein
VRAVENWQTPIPVAPTTPHSELMHSIAEAIRAQAAELFASTHGADLARRTSILATTHGADLARRTSILATTVLARRADA